jgi:2-amino-4-hydroxy-6-hydroxymethyldihydropteridine diphosphokinase
MTDVYLGLGSNLGDRAANLWEAVRRIEGLPGTRVRRRSPLYETAPVGPVKQGWFLNAVVAINTATPPSDLLAAAKEIEREVGRQEGVRWGPRVVDVDILLYGDERVATAELTLPHVELWNRLFVLIPLLDVLPEGSLAEQVRERIGALGPGSDTIRRHAPGA